jgi:predicted acylesterase/phospholipase RssA
MAAFIPTQSSCALILPGAVAKGAYEAGVIEVLVEQDIRIDRIVATSSGALNGVAYAAGIRSGHEQEMAAKLVDAWVEGGSWNNSFSLSPLNWLSGRGLSDSSGLLKMLRGMVVPSIKSAKREIELRIIVSPLKGVQDTIGKRAASTYEKVLCFSGEDFDTAEGLERIFKVVTAACAFPGLYAPVELPGIGPCVDGGAVNNAPVRYALDECDIRHIIVPVPFPSVMPPSAPLSGWGLAGHLTDILINERLFRDLKDANIVNREVAQLEGLVTSGVLNAEQLKAVISILKTRIVQITEVRPAQPLSGSSFSGFFKKNDRVALIAEGREAARKAFFLTDAETGEKQKKEIETVS